MRPRGIAGRTRRQLASGLISELAATGQEDQGRPHIAGLLARAIAVAAAQIHLAAEHDVVIPQFLGRAEFLEQLKDLAHKAGADFMKLSCSTAGRTRCAAFAERGCQANGPAAQAHEMADHRGGIEELSAMYDRLLSVIASRPAARVVPTRSGHMEQA